MKLEIGRQSSHFLAALCFNSVTTSHYKTGNSLTNILGVEEFFDSHLYFLQFL